MSEAKNKIKIGISVGDLNGIGVEVIMKALSDSRMLEICTPVIYASQSVFSHYRKLLDMPNFTFQVIKAASEAKAKKINLLNLWEEDIKIEAGKVDPTLGRYAFSSLDSAVKDLKEKNIDALVTAPINKKTIQSEDFNFPGHTEYLQHMAAAEDSLMFMISETAKIGLVCGHIPLKDVSKQLSTEAIFKRITLMNRSLKEDFAVQKPKIALMGLNPHTGDDGLMGSEEKEVIIPAIQQAKNIGILAFGPYAADGFFGSGQYVHFDGILGMYHDQALIPAKLLSFGNGVNFTAGLSFVRTSPDHGTAYDLAGKNQADENSFRKAIYSAIDIFNNRLNYNELKKDPLSISKNRK